jgi:hypothetical protein
MTAALVADYIHPPALGGAALALDRSGRQLASSATIPLPV